MGEQWAFIIVSGLSKWKEKNASDIPDVNKKNDYNIIHGKSPHFMLLAAFVFWLLNFLFDWN